jgi:hypothetical protein
MSAAQIVSSRQSVAAPLPFWAISQFKVCELHPLASVCSPNSAAVQRSRTRNIPSVKIANSGNGRKKRKRPTGEKRSDYSSLIHGINLY